MFKINLYTPKLSFELESKHKVTIVIGDSGIGKTAFVNAVLRPTSKTSISIIGKDDITILTCKMFKDYLKKAHNGLRSLNVDIDTLAKSDDARDRKKYKRLLCSYWSDSDNFPYENYVIVIDDEDFVRSLAFSAFFSADTTNSYVIMAREHFLDINYKVDSLYTFKYDNGVNRLVEYPIPFDTNQVADLNSIVSFLARLHNY